MPYPPTYRFDGHTPLCGEASRYRLKRRAASGLSSPHHSSSPCAPGSATPTSPLSVSPHPGVARARPSLPDGQPILRNIRRRAGLGNRSTNRAFSQAPMVSSP
jgi:hypothetical protein